MNEPDGETLADQLERPEPRAKRKKGEGGRFFAIDQRTWSNLMQHGINAACAYLVIAQGTASDNKNTAWSTNSVMKYAGLGWESAKQAIERLMANGFVRHGDGHTQERPRYELVAFSELSQLDLKRLSAQQKWVLKKVSDGTRPRGKSERAVVDELLTRGLLCRDGLYADYSLPEAVIDDPKYLIWLPNAIVRGTPSGEEAPVKRLRSAGDIWALRLFVDLYHSQNLRDDGGINRRVIWCEYARHKAGEQGIYIAWGFEEKQKWVRFTGPLAVHQSKPKPKDGDHPIWETIKLLGNLRLLSFVPHILENDTEEAQPIHSYGIGGVAEVAIERQIAEAADAAARTMCLQEQVYRMESYQNCKHFCPVINTLPNAQMVGIARLTYRPHTKRTGAWFAELNSTAPVWIERYQRLANKGIDVAATHGLMTA